MTFTVTTAGPITPRSPPDRPGTPGADPLTDQQRERIRAWFAADELVQVEATWGVNQRMIAAYRGPDAGKGRAAMKAIKKLIDALRSGVPAALREILTLGRTLKKRAADFLAAPRRQQRPHRGHGRLDHLRGSALGSRNLAHSIARSPSSSDEPFATLSMGVIRDRRVCRQSVKNTLATSSITSRYVAVSYDRALQTGDPEHTTPRRRASPCRGAGRRRSRRDLFGPRSDPQGY